MTAVLAISRLGNRRIVLAWLRFALRLDFVFMAVASNTTAQTIRLRSE